MGRRGFWALTIRPINQLNIYYVRSTNPNHGGRRCMGHAMMAALAAGLEMWCPGTERNKLALPAA